MGLQEVVDDLGLFRHTKPPEEPDEFRLAAQLVRGLTYVMFAGTVLAPVGIVYGAVANDALVLMASLVAVPSFLLLALAYPAFVAGERWSLFAILIVGVGLAILAPLRFVTEAASLNAYVAAEPPQVREVALFVAAFILIYVLLLPETREGMRQARGSGYQDRFARAAPTTAPPDRDGGASPSRSAAGDGSPYVCPECANVYMVRKMPPPGTRCPGCRATP